MAETLINILQKRFIQEDHQYRLFKIHEKNIVYDGEAEIYHYDDSHTDFLKMLPSITNIFEKNEAKFKAYYEYASSSSYSADTATEKIKKLNKSFQKIHLFLQHSDVALLNIRRILFDYFCKTSSYRFLTHLKDTLDQALPDLDKYRNKDLEAEEQEEYNQLIQTWIDRFQKEFPNFEERENKLFKNLFLPIYNLMYPEDNETTIKSKLNNLWMLFRHSDYNHFKSEKEQDRRTFHQYLYQSTQDEIQNKYSKISILFHLEIISDIFSDYFSVFSDLSDICKTATSFHPYALLLTNNYRFYTILDSCKFYSEHQTMSKLITDNLQKIYRLKNTGTPILFLDEIAKTLSNDFYIILKQLINSPKEDTQDYISRQLIEYYPSELEAYMGGTLIEFQRFEQLIAIELLDIIVQNKSIKKCPTCSIYFISSSKNRKYCEAHKNNHSACQKIFTSKKTAVEKMYSQYYSCFYARLKRKRISQKVFNNWNEKSLELVQTYKSLHKYDIDQFKKELNSICSKFDIKLPNKYSKSS